MQKFCKLFNKAFDLLLGFEIEKEKEKQLMFDYYSRDEIMHYQKENFNKLTEIAANSKYYKGYLGKDLSEFPLVDRSEYQNNYMHMRTGNSSKYYFRYSSGTTGTPVPQFVTKDMLLAKRASHQKMLCWYGLERESPEFYLRGGAPIGIINKLYYYLKNKRFHMSGSITDKTILNIANKYNRFKPEILSGYPSAVHRFLALTLENNKYLSQPKIILTHAENLYPDMINFFKQVFPQVQVVNQYWATEGNIAETCPHGNLHINENAVICEVLNCDDNGIGDLYITNLFSYVVPIIRYKIGDRIKLSDKTCSCGRNTKIIESFDGRESDYLELEDGRRFTTGYLTGIIDYQSEGIITYQLDYDKSKKKITLKYVPTKTKQSINELYFKNYFKTKFGLSFDYKEVVRLDYGLSGKLKRLNNLN